MVGEGLVVVVGVGVGLEVGLDVGLGEGRTTVRGRCKVRGMLS